MKKASAPGKLILSGEHAVVYGQPAIALAVNRYAQAWTSSTTSHLISFNLLNLSYQKAMTLKGLRKLKKRLSLSYDAFLRNEIHIKDVLKFPAELSKYAVGHLLDKINHSLNERRGCEINTYSTIPVGCGMGSSAAMILCVMHALALQQGCELDESSYLEYAKSVENLQHGYSSGLDIHAALLGGMIFFENGHIRQSNFPTDISLYMVNTGRPQSSTGECVAAVKPIFTQSLLSEFASITRAMEDAIEKRSFSDIQEAVRHNHALLAQIGVIPEKVEKFIQALEQQGIAAKTCGSGAVRGEQAGIVLIIAAEPPYSICEQFGYQLEEITPELQGLRTLDE